MVWIIGIFPVLHPKTDRYIKGVIFPRQNATLKGIFRNGGPATIWRNIMSICTYFFFLKNSLQPIVMFCCFNLLSSLAFCLQIYSSLISFNNCFNVILKLCTVYKYVEQARYSTVYTTSLNIQEGQS